MTDPMEEYARINKRTRKHELRSLCSLAREAEYTREMYQDKLQVLSEFVRRTYGVILPADTVEDIIGEELWEELGLTLT